MYCAAKLNPVCAVNRSVRGWWAAEKRCVLMPLLASQAPVYLFNDDFRAGWAILRAGDFNKETALGELYGVGVIRYTYCLCV